MTTVVKSQLNPLANAFVPTKSTVVIVSSSKKTIQHSIESENEAKTTWEERGKLNSDDLKSEYKTKMNTKQDFKNLFFQNIVFSSITSFLNVYFNPTPDQTDFQIPMFPEYLTDNDQKLVQKSKADETPETLAVEKDECSCPPMFGWVIPPDFIGNPFNFKYECNIKYPHSPNCTVKLKSDVDTLDYLDTQISQLTLDQCFSKVKDILADVCKITDPDPIQKCDRSDESNGFGTESASLTEIEPELIDDGVHPLLQSPPFDDEDEEVSVEDAVKILGINMSSPLPQYIDPVSEVGAACNPPCSQWCEFLPSAAKDTFRKYVQKSIDTGRNECHQRSAIGYRPVFKRSLSANDAPMYSRFSQDFSVSETVPRDMLLLRRKDPLNYFKIQSPNTLTKGKHASCDLTDQQLLASSIESKMWGKFDGKDSLWQPLPECNTVNTNNQKPNLKKGRETRRQRTMS